MTAGEDSAPDLRIWSLVRTHCVEGNVRQHRGGVQLLRFLDFENFVSLVRAAFRACAMRQFALVAIRTFAQTDWCEGVVCAALGSAGLGVAPLWIRHCRFLSFVRQQSFTKK